MKKGFLKTGCTKIRISNFQCPGTGVAENLVVYFLGYSLILFTEIPSHTLKKSYLKEQSARDKIRVIIYFIGYKAMMKSNDYSPFSEYSNLIFDIYQCRNLNHRGNTNNEYEQSTYDRILPMKSFYYFKFMGALTQFIEYIKDGYDNLKTIHDYALTC